MLGHESTAKGKDFPLVDNAKQNTHTGDTGKKGMYGTNRVQIVSYTRHGNKRASLLGM